MISMGCTTSTTVQETLISPKEFEALIAGLEAGKEPEWVILDVRRDDEIKAKRLPSVNAKGATVPLLYHELSTLEGAASKLPKNKLLYCFCRSGNRSGKASELLRTKGFNTINVEGGILALDHIAVSG